MSKHVICIFWAFRLPFDFWILRHSVFVRLYLIKYFSRKWREMNISKEFLQAPYRLLIPNMSSVQLAIGRYWLWVLSSIWVGVCNDVVSVSLNERIIIQWRSIKTKSTRIDLYINTHFAGNPNATRWKMKRKGEKCRGRDYKKCTFTHKIFSITGKM